MNPIRQKTAQGLQVGDEFTVVRKFTKKDMLKFAEISRDYNPVHFDPRFAKSKGFYGCVCHGLLIAGMLTEIGGLIGWLASGMELKFKKPVYFEDTITCKFTIKEIDSKNRAWAEIRMSNEEGQTVLEATLKGILPNEYEKTLLKEVKE